MANATGGGVPFRLETAPPYTEKCSGSDSRFSSSSSPELRIAAIDPPESKHRPHAIAVSLLHPITDRHHRFHRRPSPAHGISGCNGSQRRPRACGSTTPRMEKIDHPFPRAPVSSAPLKPSGSGRGQCADLDPEYLAGVAHLSGHGCGRHHQRAHEDGAPGHASLATLEIAVT